MQPRQRAVRALLPIVVSVAFLTSACASRPPRNELATKLEVVNGLTRTQAACVANGLYDGMPSAGPGKPAIAKLTTGELRAVAKANNAGKVLPDTVEEIRAVAGRCVPSAATITNP